MDDRTAIADLIYTYAARMDAGDLDGVAALFERGETVTSSGTAIHGRPAVREHLGRTVRLFEDGTPRTRHVTTNLVIEIDPSGTARARSYVTVLQQAGPDMVLQPIFAGRYDDTFRRHDGVWALERREKRADLVGDLSRHLSTGGPVPGGAPMAGAMAPESIRQVLARYCRAVDRMDRALLLSCFTPDATLDYVGIHTGTPDSFADFLWPSHGALVGHAHQIATPLIEVDGTRATSEAPVTIALWRPAGSEVSETVIRGRYLDRWTLAGDGWRIDERVHVIDLRTVDGRPDQADRADRPDRAGVQPAP